LACTVKSCGLLDSPNRRSDKAYGPLVTKITVLKIAARNFYGQAASAAVEIWWSLVESRKRSMMNRELCCKRAIRRIAKRGSSG
jgi:hypothetical protein